MSRLSARHLSLAFAVFVMVGATFASSASATQLITNGGFETGTLEGWHASYETNEGKWFAFDRKEGEERPPGLLPPSGEFAAGDEFHYPDSAILYQEVTLPVASDDQLSMSLAYWSAAPMGNPSPNSLAVKGLGGGNQQLRVDVLKKGAPLRSLESGDILTTVYATNASSPQELEPTQLTANLSSFAGQTVVLRIANIVEDNGMEAVVDNVSIESTPVGPSTVTVIKPPVPPSNVFTEGKLTLNKKSGTGFLSVNLPDAGVLTAVAQRQLAVASAAAIKFGKRKPVLIKTATVSAAGPGMVKVPIVPTTAGKKILKEKGELGFLLELNFAPTGGTPAAQRFIGKLVKTLKPARK